MRTQLFRTNPVLVDGAEVLVALVDVDGVSPLTVFVENLAVQASLTTVGLFRTKNANLTFTAVTAGTGGNAITVQFVIGVNSVFGVAVVADAITITLRGDASGSPYSEQNLATKIVEAVIASGAASALVTPTLAPGSDGLGLLDITASTAILSLAGGAAAGDIANVKIAISDLPPAQTPAAGWIVEINEMPTAGGVTAYEFDPPAAVRGLRVRASKGAANGMLVAAAICTKKGL